MSVRILETVKIRKLYNQTVLKSACSEMCKVDPTTVEDQPATTGLQV